MSDIITKEMLEKYRAKHWILEGELTYNTITQAVELLERMANLYPYRIEFVNDPNCCEQCKAKRNAQQWLACYHAADSSPQSQPSPPQK